MSERLILFTGAMVRAILAGAKSSTRRVIKPQPAADMVPWGNNQLINGFALFCESRHQRQGEKGRTEHIKCPYGNVGERLRASGLTLQITAVRVERLQDIDEAAVIAEGVWPEGWAYGDGKPQKKFAVQWDATNAKRGFGWDANPWVWVIDFMRVG